MARCRVSAAAKGATENHECADWLERLTTMHFADVDGIFKPTRKLVAPDKKTGHDLEVNSKNIKGHEHFTQKKFQGCEFKVDACYEPSWRNLESTDSLFMSGKVLCLIQMTSSPRHPVKAAGIGAVCKAAKERHSDLEGHVFIFVLPEGSSRGGKDCVKDFACQSHVKSNGKVAEHGIVCGFPKLKSELGQPAPVCPSRCSGTRGKGDLIPRCTRNSAMWTMTRCSAADFCCVTFDKDCFHKRHVMCVVILPCHSSNSVRSAAGQQLGNELWGVARVMFARLLLCRCHSGNSVQQWVIMLGNEMWGVLHLLLQHGNAEPDKVPHVCDPIISRTRNISEKPRNRSDASQKSVKPGDDGVVNSAALCDAL
eukprot:jgi/Bigna1/70862/fgenesh1_pg.13_\